MSSNLTVAHPTIPQFHPIFHAHPIYYSPAHSLLTSLSDHILTVIAPVIAYWVTSGVFHILDSSNWAWLNRYRIHDSAEVASRNRASRLEVLLAVFVQQLIQTVLGLLWVSEVTEHTDHATAMRSIAHYLVSSLGLFDEAAPQLAYLLYWWLIPAVQMFVAMCVKSCSISLTYRSQLLNFFF
jgi:sphinganine C4-monooxygenase